MLTASKKRASDQRQVAHAQMLLGKVQEKTKEKSNDIRRDIETARWFSDMTFTTSVEESMVLVPEIPGIETDDTSDLEVSGDSLSELKSKSTASLVTEESISTPTQYPTRKPASMSTLTQASGLRQRRPTATSASTFELTGTENSVNGVVEDALRAPEVSTEDHETVLQMVKSAIVSLWRWFVKI